MTLEDAIALHQKSDWRSAEAAYRSVLSREPKNPDALALLGSVLSEQKKHAEAIASIEKALSLDPQAPLFHFHLGNAFEKAKQHDKAEAAFAVATALAPPFAEAWYNLGNAQRAQNKMDAAKASYEKTLKLNPQHALAHNNLAMLLLKKGDAAGARKQIEEGLKSQPNHVSLLLNLSEVALEQNDLPTAFAAARRAAETKLGIPPGDTAYLSQPGFFRGHDEEGLNTLLTLATSHLLQGRLEEASAILRGMLAEEPDMEEVFSSLGIVALARNKLGQAEECYAQSFMLDPSNIAAPWNRAMVQLTRGDLREGFRRYRWRWHAMDKFKALRLDAPMWNGGELKGKTILIHEEQGFGDSLQMLRFMPELKKRGAKVYFYAQPPLHPLLETWEGIDRTWPWNLKDKTLPPGVDLVCGVMDLPGLLGIHLNNIPAKTPYLPNPKRGDAAYELEGSRKKIGLVWSGNPLHKRDHERSMPLEKFEALIKSVDADFFSLQHRPKEADQKRLQEWEITDLAPRIKNLADMAAFMSQLDLLITIDSAPAHLAGGLGIPTWLLVTCNPDWRWLLERQDSPWYPQTRLFRQPRPGDWNAVIASLKTALPREIAAKAH